MKTLILNSGLGQRMGELTKEHPKCMTKISENETILSRQLELLADFGIYEVIITTGYYDSILTEYCASLDLPLKIKFVKNELYDKTNYIYSIYCALNELENDDILLMHGDLVFETRVLEKVLKNETSCMTVSSTIPLPKKDFKAVIQDGKITKVGIDFFESALSAQPIYKLKKEDWSIWQENIRTFCERNERNCYAENALNEVLLKMNLFPLDVKNMLCAEIDNPDDLKKVFEALRIIETKKVYMCFSSDVIVSGHIEIIKKAAKLGCLTIGVLSDNAVASYKYTPFLPESDRVLLFKNIKGVHDVVLQQSLSYRDAIERLKPDFVVHGDDWKIGTQEHIRTECIRLLSSYGGELVEYPYSDSTIAEKNIRQSSTLFNLQNEEKKVVLSIGHIKTMLDSYGITKLFFVCGKHIKENSVYSMLKAVDFPFYEFSDFTVNPKYEDVISGARKYMAWQCNGILAVGGGSTIDMAKCIKFQCLKECEKVPLFVIPTTAGTGSEATQFAVIYKDGVKISVDSPLLLPDEVFKETAFLSSVPEYHRKAAAFDSLCHAIESWWSPKATKESISYSALAIKTLCKCMKKYISGSTDPKILEKMFFAANYAGKSINITRTTAPHAMSYKLTSMYKIAHGHAVALCLPKVWRYMLNHCDNALSDIFFAIAIAMGANTPNDAIELFTEWTETAGFYAPKISDEEIDVLVKSVDKARLKNNPIKLSDDILQKLYYSL